MPSIAEKDCLLVAIVAIQFMAKADNQRFLLS
jgi:hypothetical protein